MKNKYPMEAFALAMIIFTQNMRVALITGILVLFITTLGLVIDELLLNRLPIWSRNSCTIILMVSFSYSIFRIVTIGILGFTMDNTDYIFHIFLGILIANHIIHVEGKPYYNRLLFEGAGAYAIMLIISIIREFMANGSIYGYEISEFSFTSDGFSKVAMGLMLTAIGIAVLNKIYRYENIKTKSILVILPVVLLVRPIELSGIESSLGTLISIVIALLLVYSVKRYLIFSKLSKEIKYLPADLMSTGMIYIIFSMF